jgi:hypothetical protein
MLFAGTYLDVQNTDHIFGMTFILIGFPIFWTLIFVIPFLRSDYWVCEFIWVWYFVQLVIIFLIFSPDFVFTGPTAWSSYMVAAGITIAALQPAVVRILSWYERRQDELRSLEQKRRESDYMNTD